MMTSAAPNGLALGLAAASLVYGAVWRRRARMASNADLRAFEWEQTETLMRHRELGEGDVALAGWVVEAKTPPDGTRRWYWWINVTCSFCSEQGEVQHVHDAQTGWEMTKHAAEEARERARRWLTYDSDSCPVLLAQAAAWRAEHGEDDDDEDDDDEDDDTATSDA